MPCFFRVVFSRIPEEIQEGEAPCRRHFCYEGWGSGNATNIQNTIYSNWDMGILYSMFGIWEYYIVYQIYYIVLGYGNTICTIWLYGTLYYIQQYNNYYT